MNVQQITTSARKTGNWFALAALAVTFFGVGVTEFISIGILPGVANDFGVSISTAGLIVSMYALGVAVGGPILTSLTAKLNRKRVLLAMIVLFIIGHFITAIAPVFSLVLAGRVLSAFSHGVFFALGSTVAANLVPQNRRGSAIAFVFGGFTIATAIGAPLGTYLSEIFGWRLPFYGITLIGIIALVLNAVAIPDIKRSTGIPPSFKEQLKLITTGRILLVLAITIIGYGGTFATFTYLSPILRKLTGYGGTAISFILFLYGVAIAVGNHFGGRLGNDKPVHALFYIFLVQAVILLLFTFTAPSKTLGLINVIAMGLLAFMSVPVLQAYVLTLAERYAPSAVDFASSLNIASFNGGIALGAYIGGVVADGIGLQHTSWMAAVMVGLGALLTLGSMKLENKHIREQGNETDRPAQ
ncbi:MFS transporter [Paenibacillus pasadenensis]|uniref:MFS transporter n=1 Tax=Paenibacillus pasadenensis TaxID=217090 RepID=UPI00203BD373|nr:MFS transporter [Paenibacillus pasadenensis]MCM3747355.1 MFS transporter [Paenibacillus pasadenensis]